MAYQFTVKASVKTEDQQGQEPCCGSGQCGRQHVLASVQPAEAIHAICRNKFGTMKKALRLQMAAAGSSQATLSVLM